MPDEINHDGKIITAATSLVPNLDTSIINVLSQANWSPASVRTDGSLRVFTLTDPLGNTTTLNIFLGTIRSEARATYEKKLQLGGKDPRVLKRTDTASSRTYIIGIYVLNASDPIEESLIAAWPIIEGTEYPGNPSLRIKAGQLQSGKIYGFSQEPNNAGDLICAFRPEFIHFYLKNSVVLHKSKIDQLAPTATTPPLIDLSVPRNKILYGAPGTGKSYELRNQAKAVGFDNDKIIRVTFHPNYSYQQFVGSYKPTPIYKTLSVSEGLELYGTDKMNKLANQKEPLIDYVLVPGPFLIQLINALNNPDANYLIIIEEINRASVSAVFGDVFQLLDRSDTGESEYDIEFSADIANYLKSVGIDEPKIKIPSNLFIWATMNSADQGVMPLDAAFKRRWSFEYLSIDANETHIEDREIQYQTIKYPWNKFRKTLNATLKEISVPEDKLIGPFFLSKAELESEDAITNKLLLYLRDDVVRHNPESLFKEKAFSDIISGYEAGDEIFVNLNSSHWKEEDKSTDPQVK